MKVTALALAGLLLVGCKAPVRAPDAPPPPAVTLSKGGGTYSTSPLAEDPAPRVLPHIRPRDIAAEQVNVARHGLSLRLATPGKIHWNSRIDYALAFRDMPKTTRLFVTIVHDTARNSGEFEGRYAELPAQATVSGSADLRFSTVLKTGWCAEIDLMMPCGLAPGRYRLQAAFANPPASGAFGAPDYKPATIIGEVYSAPFEVTGDVPTDLIKPHFEGSARSYIAALTKLGQMRQSPQFAPQPAAVGLRPGAPCQILTLLPPLTGKVSACLPPAAFTDAGIRADQRLRVGGVVGYSSSLRPEDALALARYAVDRRRAEPLPLVTPPNVIGGPITGTDLEGWDFKDGAWSFEFVDHLYRFQVRVEGDGKSCVTAIGPMASGFDRRKTLPPCPANDAP